MTITTPDTQPRTTRTRMRARLQDIAYAKARRRKKVAAPVEVAPEPASPPPEQAAVAAQPETSAPDSLLTNLAPAPHAGRVTKNDLVLQQLRTPEGTSITEMMASTGWLAHSVRGFLSAVVRKKLGLTLLSDVDEHGTRRYRIDAQAAV